MRFPNKTFLVSCALVCFVIMAVAFAAPPERRFKNLKILPKNITEKELDSVMHEFSSGLNVKCNFCHAPQKHDPQKIDWASDELPEKNIARKMMKLTAKINKKWFDYAKDEQGKTVAVVGCYTCHHGDPRPVRTSQAKQ